MGDVDVSDAWVWALAVCWLSAAACGDDQLERSERDAAVSQQRTAADAASIDAGCPTCLPKVDAGSSRAVPGAEEEAGALDAQGCLVHKAPCDTVPCAWKEAQAKLPACARPPLTPWWAARCGDYDAFVRQGADSLRYYFYDAKGRLVGSRDLGMGVGCESFDRSFRVPERCAMATPKCSLDEDAGS